MKASNYIDEFLYSNTENEANENFNEMCQETKIEKFIYIGHFLMYSFAKVQKEFSNIYKLIIRLFESQIINEADIVQG